MNNRLALLLLTPSSTGILTGGKQAVEDLVRPLARPGAGAGRGRCPASPPAATGGGCGSRPLPGFAAGGESQAATWARRSSGSRRMRSRTSRNAVSSSRFIGRPSAWGGAKGAGHQRRAAPPSGWPDRAAPSASVPAGGGRARGGRPGHGAVGIGSLHRVARTVQRRFRPAATAERGQDGARLTVRHKR